MHNNWELLISQKRFLSITVSVVSPVFIIIIAITWVGLVVTAKYFFGFDQNVSVAL